MKKVLSFLVILLHIVNFHNVLSKELNQEVVEIKQGHSELLNRCKHNRVQNKIFIGSAYWKYDASSISNVFSDLGDLITFKYSTIAQSYRACDIHYITEQMRKKCNSQDECLISANWEGWGVKSCDRWTYMYIHYFCRN